MAADILVAKRSAIIMFGGRRVTIRAGLTRVRVGHPILTGREDMFEPIQVDFDIEQPAEPEAEPQTKSAPASKPAGRRQPSGRKKQA